MRCRFRSWFRTLASVNCKSHCIHTWSHVFLHYWGKCLISQQRNIWTRSYITYDTYIHNQDLYGILFLNGQENLMPHEFLRFPLASPRALAPSHGSWGLTLPTSTNLPATYQQPSTSPTNGRTPPWTYLGLTSSTTNLYRLTPDHQLGSSRTTNLCDEQFVGANWWWLVNNVNNHVSWCSTMVGPKWWSWWTSRYNSQWNGRDFRYVMSCCCRVRKHI